MDYSSEEECEFDIDVDVDVNNVKQGWHSIGFQFQFFMWPANRFWNN